MIRESICKINLGLNIVRRRADGYHDIETLMYPIRGLSDIVEVLPSDHFSFSSSGLGVDCPTDKNLCVRAFRLMQSKFSLGEARIHLHKRIPTGAGLGGGSANATTVILLCNELWSLGLSAEKLEELAAEIGSDTPFFVRSEPQIATGRGEILKPFGEISLTGLWLLMVKPDIGVSTAEAYSAVNPKPAEISISDILEKPIEMWRGILKNDFEPSVFAKLPRLGEIKQEMYDNGALYAAMSGSGSTIFGLFKERPEPPGSSDFTHIELL